MACDGGTAAGIAIGCILGTLVIVGIVLAILYLLWKKKQAKENATSLKKWEANENPIYENKAFTRDVEKTGTGKPQNGDANKLANVDLPASYTECRDRSSPDRDKDVDNAVHAGRSKAKKSRRNLFSDSKGKSKTVEFPIHKTGSHGSLDGAVTPNYPEVISVSLQSQDIIGLGFNISGSLSEGIFVSQVHNRGPASESGRIQVGDRILNITISMTNMVYEDALTILSYASPYPVILQLQKAMPFPSDDPSMDDPSKLSHPIYRSQSLDDLSKINRDRWTGPRKTWTQLRRIHPTKDEDREEIEGQLKKWSATQNIVSEEAGFTRPGDIKSSASNISTDISLDMDEIINASSGTLLTSTPGGAQVVHVEIPDQSDFDDADDHGVKRKSVIGSEEDIAVDDSGVALDAPPSKRSKDSTSGDSEPFPNGLSQDPEISDLSVAKLEQITVAIMDNAKTEVSKWNNKDETEKFSDKSNSSRSSVSSESVSSLSSDSITESGEERKKTGSYDVTDIPDVEWQFQDNISEQNEEIDRDCADKKVSFADINENKIMLDKSMGIVHETTDVVAVSEEVEDMTEEVDTDNTTEEATTESFDVSAISTEVNVGESVLVHDTTEDDIPPETDAHEDEVRAVLKDYFSDDPSLLEQFGFMGGELGGLNKTVEISSSVTTNDGETVTTTTKTETVETSETIEVS